MEIRTIGIDLGKTVFHFRVVHHSGLIQICHLVCVGEVVQLERRTVYTVRQFNWRTMECCQSYWLLFPLCQSWRW